MLALMTIGLTGPLAAQRQAITLARGFAVSGSVEGFLVPADGGARFGGASLRLGGFNPDGNGVEATVAVAGIGGSDGGAGLLLADMDFTRGIPLEGPTLELRAGGGFMVVGGATPTVNVGMSLIVPVTPKFGFRVDGTVRSLVLLLPHANLFSLGVGVIALP